MQYQENSKRRTKASSVAAIGLTCAALLSAAACSRQQGATKPPPGDGPQSPSTTPNNPQPPVADSRPAPAFPNQAVLDTKLHGQETSQWCWAASAQTIMDTLGTSRDIRQCVQAKHLFSPPAGDCCANNGAKGCTQPAWPDFDFFGFSASTTSDNGGLSFPQIQEQIAAKRSPIAFTWNWVGGNAHMQVLYGYKIQAGQQSVRIFNPLPEKSGFSRWIDYQEYVADPTHHTHSRDYYNISLLAGGPEPVPNTTPSTAVAANSSAPNSLLSRTALLVSDPDSRTPGRLPPADKQTPGGQPGDPETNDPFLRAARPKQSSEFTATLRGAQPALLSGIATLAPPDFSQPPPGAPPASVGVATPVVNLAVSDLIPAQAGVSKPTPRALASNIESKLDHTPGEMAIPIAGPNGHNGVLVLRHRDAGWASISFEQSSPLSDALNQANVKNSGASVLSLRGDLNALLGAPAEPGASGPAVKTYQLKGIVTVNGLNLAFAAFEEPDGLHLDPLWNSPEFGLETGQLAKAVDVLKTLQSKATLDEKPR